MGPATGDRGPGDGPRGDGWREEAVTFPSGSRRLVGVLTLPIPDLRTRNPEPGTRSPGVVVLHGWGSYRSGPHRMLVELCRTLAARGSAALRFDLCGRGDSGGGYWEADLDAMIADARAAADFLAGRTGAAGLAAAGLCSGANVALGAAAGDDRFGAVAALSALPFQKQRGAGQAAERARGTLGELGRKALRIETWRRLLRGEVAVGRILRRLLGGEGGRSARAAGSGGERRNLKDSARDIQAELAGCRARLLFVHGAADAEGLSGWRAVWAPFFESRGLTHRHLEVPGADHDYHSLAAKRRAIAETCDFLALPD